MHDRMSRILAAFYGAVWCMRPDVLNAMHAVLLRWASGNRLDDAQIRAAIGDAPQVAAQNRERASRGAGSVAVIPVYGVLSPRAHMVEDISGSGGTSTERLARQFRQALADDSVGAIVLDVASPGGNAQGVMELADEIYAARSRKKIVGVAAPQAASGALWLISAAEEVVVTPSGEAGSVGAYGVHEDWSKALEAEGVAVNFISYGKYKVEGNSTQPLDDEARGYMQAQVNAVGQMFERGLAKNRGLSVDDVRKNFGEGRMLLAADAVKAGMADRVDTLDNTIARLARSAQAQKPRTQASAAARLRLAELG